MSNVATDRPVAMWSLLLDINGDITALDTPCILIFDSCYQLLLSLMYIHTNIHTNALFDQISSIFFNLTNISFYLIANIFYFALSL